MPFQSVTLQFPCPQCGSHLTLNHAEAEGECPKCGILLRAQLSVQPIDSRDRKKPKGWHERTFRPSSGS